MQFHNHVFFLGGAKRGMYSSLINKYGRFIAFNKTYYIIYFDFGSENKYSMVVLREGMTCPPPPLKFDGFLYVVISISNNNKKVYPHYIVFFFKIIYQCYIIYNKYTKFTIFVVVAMNIDIYKHVLA